MKIKKEKVLLLVGIITFLITLVGATYAYFSVQLETSTSNMVLTAKTGKAGVVSLRTATPELKLKLGVEEMAKFNEGVYYADDEEDYVKSKSKGIHSLVELTITNDEEDNNIYKCNAKINISMNGTMANVLEKGDMILHLMGDNLNEEIDLSTLDNGETTIPIEIESIGNNTKKIRGYLEFANKETEQNYLDNKSLELNITTDNLQCDLTGRVGVYAKLNYDEESFLGLLYKDSLLKPFVQTYIDNEQLKDVSFVDYINTDKAVATQDFTDTEKSPTGSVMGWVEEDSEDTGYYNLYIGSESDIYAENLAAVFSGIGNVNNIHLENLHFEKATDISSFFNSTKVLSSVTYNTIDTSNITDMSSMFGYSGLTPSYFNFETWDTSNVTDMSGMFAYTTVESLYLSGWDTSNVTNMWGMLRGMSSLTELDVSSFYTGNVTEMRMMFKDDSSLTELDLSNFDTSGVKNMSDIFYGLEKITSLDLSNFDTSKVTDMSYMFYGLPLESLDLSKFNTSNVTNMSNMFLLPFITTLDLSNFDTSEVTNMDAMFWNMRALEYLDMRGAEFSQVKSYGSMFTGVSNDITIIVKDEENRDWINKRLHEAGVTGKVLLPNEIEES